MYDVLINSSFFQQKPGVNNKTKYPMATRLSVWYQRLSVPNLRLDSALRYVTTIAENRKSPLQDIRL
jgi:hypothetical protein